MKLMRKTISVILAILICFCGCSLGFAEEEKAEVEKKVPMYASEMDLVKEFGFITEDNVENFDKNVTSVEFAKIMLKLMKIDFSDKADSEEIIKKAVEAQCFRGYLGTGYGPETEITIEQAATSIISALGYSRYCEYQGGYPDGYMRNANSKGILKAIKAQNKDIATMEQVVNMLYNSFEVPYMSQTIYGGKDTFSVDENKTILTEIHHIYIHEGIITANDATGLYDSSKKAQKNSVMIDKTNYNVGNTEISKLLGHRVKAYYFSDGNADAKIVAFLLKKSSDS
ncbi:MAG: hypothetical protein RR957_02615, partial [Oscillospiraceae bacterium]